MVSISHHDDKKKWKMMNTKKNMRTFSLSAFNSFFSEINLIMEIEKPSPSQLNDILALENWLKRENFALNYNVWKHQTLRYFYLTTFPFGSQTTFTQTFGVFWSFLFSDNFPFRKKKKTNELISDYNQSQPEVTRIMYKVFTFKPYYSY